MCIKGKCIQLLNEHVKSIEKTFLVAEGALLKYTHLYLDGVLDSINEIPNMNDEDAVITTQHYTRLKLAELREACYERNN